MLVGVKMKGAKTVSAVRLIDQPSPSLERPPEEHRKTLDFPKDFSRRIHQSWASSRVELGLAKCRTTPVTAPTTPVMFTRGTAEPRPEDCHQHYEGSSRRGLCAKLYSCW